MSQPDKPQIDNRLTCVVMAHEIRLGTHGTKVWHREGEKNYGFRAVLTQFGVRFEPAEVKRPAGSTIEAEGVSPVTVPLAHVLYVVHPPVKPEAPEPMPPMPTRNK